MPGALLIAAAAGFIFRERLKRLYRMHMYSAEKLLSIYGKWQHVLEAGVSPADRGLVSSIIAVESAGDPNARSGKDAVGLMQITFPVIEEYYQETGAKYSLMDLYAPELNVKIGYWYLQRLITHYKLDLWNALRAYNAGIGRIRKDGKISVQYADRILAYSYLIDYRRGKA